MYYKDLNQQATVEQKAAMIVTAPVWLRLAREVRTKLGAADWERVTKNPLLLREVSDLTPSVPNQLSLEAFLGGVRNEVMEAQLASNFPELNGIRGLRPDTELKTITRITTEHDKTFIVIDASEEVGFSQSLLAQNPAAYGVLVARLLEYMIELDATGAPQILSLEQTSGSSYQQVVAQVNEIHLEDQSHMYFTVVPNPDREAIARIVIIGSHGGNKHARQQFLRDVLGV